MNSSEIVHVVTILAERAPETAGVMNVNGQVIFHLLCEYKVPLEVIKVLVRLYPDALRHADLEGRLPLHYALEKECCSEFVQVLLVGFPGAVALRDKQGRLPLFIASDAHASLDVTFDLIRWSPEVLCEFNQNDDI
jgi:hypothetical protein